MNTKKRLFASALLIGLAAAWVLISGSQNVAKAGPGAAPVSIMSPLPLPVTGTVSGTVGATQSGTWSVGITGTPNVNVGTPTVNVSSMPAVSFAGTPTVNIGGSAGVLLTQDLSTLASQNVLLQNRVLSNHTGGLLALSSTGRSFNCCYTVPGGQTLVVTTIDITPVTPGSGTNHITLLGTIGGTTSAVFRSFEVSNASSTHLDYPTGIAIGSAEQVLIINGFLDTNNPLFSAGDVDVYLQGYLTNN